MSRLSASVPESHWGWHLPSEEELKKARNDDRADGWGFVAAVTPEEWLNTKCTSATPGEKTLLESGQILMHHSKSKCSGDCCLHGTSSHASCRMPRSWRYDIGIIEHMCPHGVGHPCYAGLAYANSMGQHHGDGVHGCDGCCVSVDNRPSDLNALNDYMLYEHAGRLDAIGEHFGWLKEDVAELQGRMAKMSWLWLLTIVAFGLAFFLAQ